MAVADVTPAPVGAAAPHEGELKPSVPVKLFYGAGNLVENGWLSASAFVFFYYTGVLGLSGSLVGLALFIGMCVDAGVDPVIGSWSDNYRSRWGRRLPLMVIGAPFVVLGVGLHFAPPAGLSEPLLFAWLVGTGVLLRAALSLFNLPYIALGAELADGYTERSSVVAYRAVYGIVAGVVVTALAYSVFFAGEGGLQRPERYPGFGWSIAVMFLVGAVICCLGVARYAAGLPRPDIHPSSMARRLPGEVREVFRNRSFRTLFFSAVIFWAAIGMNASLANHVQIFVWRMRPEMMQVPAYTYLFGVLIGVAIAPRLTRLIEKKDMVLGGLGAVCLCWTVLPLLRATGVYTPTGLEAVFPIALNNFAAGLGIGFVVIALPSMMADAADEHELLFRHRREGLYFAGLAFAGKAAAGVGVLLAGFAIDLLGFPEDAGRDVGAVLPEPVLVRLTLAWGPLAALVGLAALAILTAYNITRSRHDEISSRLRPKREVGTSAALAE